MISLSMYRVDANRIIKLVLLNPFPHGFGRSHPDGNSFSLSSLQKTTER